MVDEESGSGALKPENIEERLNSQKVAGVHLDVFEAMAHAKNHFIQADDFFSGVINRKLNFSGEPNFKDEFADFIFDTLGFDIVNMILRLMIQEHPWFLI